MNYFFTSDEHYGHLNIIKYCKRPFRDANEMDKNLISLHNDVVGKDDLVIHAGDFTLKNKSAAQEYISRLNGTHIFLKGSHDNWLPLNAPSIWESKIDGNYIVVCHYAMRVWARSHYNSWQLYGHSHGQLAPKGKQWDIGVDSNNFRPLSFKQIFEIMERRPDNSNFISKKQQY